MVIANGMDICEDLWNRVHNKNYMEKSIMPNLRKNYFFYRDRRKKKDTALTQQHQKITKYLVTTMKLYLS